MKKQLLLCIDVKGLRNLPMLVEGHVYTYAEDATCCGSERRITVEEVPMPTRRGFTLVCMKCRAVWRGRCLPLKARRFIPINDPDADLSRDGAEEKHQVKLAKLETMYGID